MHQEAQVQADHLMFVKEKTQTVVEIYIAHPSVQAVGAEDEHHGVLQRLHVPSRAHAQLAQADDGIQHHLLHRANWSVQWQGARYFQVELDEVAPALLRRSVST